MGIRFQNGAVGPQSNRYSPTLRKAIASAQKFAAQKELPIMFRAKGGKFDKVETKYTQKQNSIEIKFGSLSPIFKWTGGKRREIKHLLDFLPCRL